MAEPFATYSDLEAGWRTLAAAEQARATILLARASRKIRSQKPTIDALILDGSVDAELVGDITCEMVKRAMQGPVDLDGVSQQQQTTGPFSSGVTFANPSGNLYLSKEEKRDLGIGVQRALMVDLIPDDEEYESSSSSSSSSS